MDFNSGKIVGDVARRVTVFAEFDDGGITENGDRKLGTQTSVKNLTRSDRLFEEYLKPTAPSASNFASVLQSN